MLNHGVAKIVFGFCPPYLPLRAVSKEMCDRPDLRAFLERQLIQRDVLHPPSGRAWQLRMAAASGDIAKIKMLLGFGTNPNSPVLQDDIVYCKNARHHCFRALLFEHGVRVHDGDDVAEINLPPSKPLFAACVCSRWDAVALLLQAGACLETLVVTCLQKTDWVPQLLPAFQRSQHDSTGALRLARRAVEDARCALEDALCATAAIQRAVASAQEVAFLDKSSCLSIVLSFCPPYLPLRAVSKEICGRTDLRGDSLLEGQLMQRGVLRPPSGRAWQLRMAAALGNIAEVKMLLRFGTNPNSLVDQDDSVYCENARHHCVRALLVEHGGCMADESEWHAGIVLPPSKPLFAACICGRWDAAGVLLQAGADLEAAVVQFVLRLPRSRIKNRLCIPCLVSREELAAHQREKDDRRRAKEDARRAWEDLRREEEDARRAKEDKRRQKEDAKREKRHARMQADVATDEELEPTTRPIVALGTAHSPAGSELSVTESSHGIALIRSRLDEHVVDGSQNLPSSEDQGARAAEALPADERAVKVIDPGEENSMLMIAIQRSRADLPALSGDDVVLYRLTRMARLPEVTSTLLESPLLLPCRERVIDAGCEISPSWSSGAKFFVPCTQQLIAELEQDTGFEILDKHILALRSDKEVIIRALKSLPRKIRPHVSAEHGTPEDFSALSGGVCALGADMNEDNSPIIIEDHSFHTDSSLGFPAFDGARGSNDAAYQ